MTLEFVWKIRGYRTFKVLANLIEQLATRRIQLQSRRKIPAKEASTFYLVLLFVFSLETWNVMAWDGLVQQTGKSYGIPEISNRDFWSNGKRPLSSCFHRQT